MSEHDELLQLSEASVDFGVVDELAAMRAKLGALADEWDADALDLEFEEGVTLMKAAVELRGALGDV